MTFSETKFTVISWANDAYNHLFEGIKKDCQRLGYPYHLYRIEDEYTSLVKAWCNHPKIIRKGVEDFGSVLFLDVECRIVAPIPSHWAAPLVSVRKPRQKFWIRYNTGTVMADQSCIPWLDAWINVIEDWQMDDLVSEDYIYWPGDICDELALAAALASLDVKVNTPELEYIDRNSSAEIARGLWQNDHTIVQHPTIHHWRKEKDLVECKKLFIQNYPGNPKQVQSIFDQHQAKVEAHGWLFDGKQGIYAPREFWNQEARQWIDKSVDITSAQR